MEFPPNINEPIIVNNYSENEINNNPIKNHHINNYGYFYIEQNHFMNLQNQQKIMIQTKNNSLLLIIIISFIFFIILFVLGIISTGNTEGALFPIIIILGVGLVVTMICMIGVCSSKSFIYYNKETHNIEVNCLKNKFNLSLDLIEKIIMEDNTENSVFYFINQSQEKIEFLKLPLSKGVPFKEGEEILNDFIDYWKKKEEENLSTQG
jgi:hypothetical protein